MIPFLVCLFTFMVILLILSIFVEKVNIKLASSIGVIISCILMVILFYNLQISNGNPDAGKELVQLYIPITILMLPIIVSIIMISKTLKQK